MPRLTLDMISSIILKIDVESDVLHWEDFLRFLEVEGEMREMINDMRIN